MSDISYDPKSQAIYASLLRYAPEFGPLRERAIDRIVCGGLIGSSSEDPFRLGLIQKKIKKAAGLPNFRQEIIQSSLTRLLKSGKIKQVELRKRHAYHLTPECSTYLEKSSIEVQELFDVVLNRSLENLDHDLSFKEGCEICRTFLINAFSKFGQDIAKAVTGYIDTKKILNIADLEHAFKNAVKPFNIEGDLRESLRIRCFKLLTSTDHNTEKLKFYLTQGYYFVSGAGSTSFFDSIRLL